MYKFIGNIDNNMGLNTTKLKITNTIGDEINPATSDNQASQIVLQQELNGMVGWLKTIVKMLKPLSIVQGTGSNRLSISVDAGTLPTVSSVTTVQNQANAGGVSMFMLQQASARNAFANGIRSNITN